MAAGIFSRVFARNEIANENPKNEGLKRPTNGRNRSASVQDLGSLLGQNGARNSAKDKPRRRRSHREVGDHALSTLMPSSSPPLDLKSAAKEFKDGRLQAREFLPVLQVSEDYIQGQREGRGVFTTSQRIGVRQLGHEYLARRGVSVTCLSPLTVVNTPAVLQRSFSPLTNGICFSSFIFKFRAVYVLH